MKYFGIKRVIEPSGAVPATAWKIDNRRDIGAGEVRINLQMVHIAWDSFSQICSYCGYDEAKIKARIIQITEERGKLQNPYTGSGGLLMGVLEEIGSDTDLQGLKVGDPVICHTSLGAIALHIDSISHIDFHYGQIDCKGYAIAFNASTIVKSYDVPHLKALLCAMDESGNFLGVRSALQEQHARRIALIGANPVTTLLYIRALTRDLYARQDLTLIFDRDVLLRLSESEMNQIFAPLVRKIFYVSLSQPMQALEQITSAGEAYTEFDAFINLGDYLGTETLSALLLKEQGLIFYATMKNNYSAGTILSESLGKEVVQYAMDGFVREGHGFAMELVDNASDDLNALDRLFSARRRHRPTKTILQEKDESSLTATERIDDFVYASPVTRAMVEDAINVAQYDCNVIIQGETGVGKEKVFNIIHQNSPRHSKPCVKINCATIQENLAESEFFGYEKGSFTGAQATGKAGYFELANNGTLFLDEIGSLSLSMQSKLLRVLQENAYYRVGGTEQKHVNVRVICANNIPLKQLVKEGKFREDLYYRLNICCIDVPPLRSRKEDIVCLAEAFLKNYNKKYGIDKELSPEAIEWLETYHWPGNVRELENAIHRLYINTRGQIIDTDEVTHLLGDSAYTELIFNIRRKIGHEEHIAFTQIIEEQEKRLIDYALKREGTTRKAAEFLGLPQATLAHKKIKYGL